MKKRKQFWANYFLLKYSSKVFLGRIFLVYIFCTEYFGLDILNKDKLYGLLWSRVDKLNIFWPPIRFNDILGWFNAKYFSFKICVKISLKISIKIGVKLLSKAQIASPAHPSIHFLHMFQLTYPVFTLTCRHNHPRSLPYLCRQ